MRREYEHHASTGTIRPDPGRAGAHTVIELAGPAGAGKTTLARALRGFDPAPRVGRTRLIGGLVPQAPALLAARLSARGRFWSADELRSLAYLSAWQAWVRAGHDRGLMVFDHGPVFRLASLLAFGPPMTQTRSFTRLWRSFAGQWAQLLSVVVWLDAPDEVLLARIADREQQHRIRGAAPGEAAAFLARYRAAYDATLAVVTGAGTPLVELDTAACPPDELAAAVRVAVQGSSDRRRGGWPT